MSSPDSSPSVLELFPTSPSPINLDPLTPLSSPGTEDSCPQTPLRSPERDEYRCAKPGEQSCVRTGGRIYVLVTELDLSRCRGGFKIYRQAYSAEPEPKVLAVFAPHERGNPKNHDDRYFLDVLVEFKKEAEMTKQMQAIGMFPPGPVEVYNSGGGLIRFVRPDVDGVQLHNVLRSNFVQNLRLLVLVAEELQIMHKFGYVHGDVKGGNIMISFVNNRPISECKICFVDFAGTSLNGGMAHTFIGECDYLAPELHCDSGKPKEVFAEPSQDIYSLGFMVKSYCGGLYGGSLVLQLQDVVNKMTSKNIAERATLGEFISVANNVLAAPRSKRLRPEHPSVLAPRPKRSRQEFFGNAEPPSKRPRGLQHPPALGELLIP